MLEKVTPVSRGKRKSISRDFNAKCDYLRELGLLADPHARVLKKLHKYRNETYHRDHLRPATLESATRIYIYLVCAIMRDGFAGHIIGFPAEPPAGLVKYLAPDERGLKLVLGPWQEIQPRIASTMLSESGVVGPCQLGEQLSQHVSARLDGIEKGVPRAGDGMGYGRGGPTAVRLRTRKVRWQAVRRPRAESGGEGSG